MTEMNNTVVAFFATAVLVGTVVSSATLREGNPQAGKPKIKLKMDTLVAQLVTGPDKQLEWKSAVTLNAPEKLTLKWDAIPGQGASAGRWELKLAGSNDVVGTGVILSVPKQGTPVQFDVDLKKYLPPQPGPTAKTYAITAWPTKVQLLPGQKKPSYPMAGNKSAPLTIKYEKASATTAKFQDLSTLNPVALPPSKYRIWFEWVKCEVETDDGPGSDEPYAVIYVCDMTKLGNADFFDSSRCRILGPYPDIDQGEQSVKSNPIFHMYNKPGGFWYDAGEIKKPGDILISAALMESDGEILATLPKVVEQTLGYRLVNLLPSQLVEGRGAAGSDLNKVLDEYQGGQGEDDRVGYAKELVITQADLKNIGLHYKYLTFTGDGGKYKMAFSMKKY